MLGIGSYMYYFTCFQPSLYYYTCFQPSLVRIVFLYFYLFIFFVLNPAHLPYAAILQ